MDKDLLGKLQKELDKLPPDRIGYLNKMKKDKSKSGYRTEPESGDEEDFRVKPYADGRNYASGVLLDFAINFGETYKKGDVPSSFTHVYSYFT